MEVSHELTTCNTKHIREQKHDEVCIVLTRRRPSRHSAPRNTEIIELSDTMPDIQNCIDGGVVAPTENALAVATV